MHHAQDDSNQRMTLIRGARAKRRLFNHRVLLECERRWFLKRIFFCVRDAARRSQRNHRTSFIQSPRRQNPRRKRANLKNLSQSTMTVLFADKPIPSIGTPWKPEQAWNELSETSTCQLFFIIKDSGRWNYYSTPSGARLEMCARCWKDSDLLYLIQCFPGFLGEVSHQALHNTRAAVHDRWCVE